ncbi:unnamed protein product, partial [Symbiodinium necroappetens]
RDAVNCREVQDFLLLRNRVPALAQPDASEPVQSAEVQEASFGIAHFEYDAVQGALLLGSSDFSWSSRVQLSARNIKMPWEKKAPNLPSAQMSLQPSTPADMFQGKYAGADESGGWWRLLRAAGLLAATAAAAAAAWTAWAAEAKEEEELLLRVLSELQRRLFHVARDVAVIAQDVRQHLKGQGVHIDEERQVLDLKSANSRRSSAYAWTSHGVGVGPASDADSELLAGPCAPTTRRNDSFQSLISFCCRVTPCRFALLCGLLFLTTMALLGRFVLNTGSDEKQGLRGAMWNSSDGLPSIGGTPEHGTPQMHEEAKPKDNRTSMHSETAQWASAAPQPGAGTTAALYPPDNATNTSFELHGEEDMLSTSAAESPTDSTSSSTWKTSFRVDGRFSSTSTGSTTTSKQPASMFVSPVHFHNSSTTRTSSASSFSSTFSSTASNIMPEGTRTAIGTVTYTTVGSTVTSSLTTFHGTTSLATTSPATTHTSSFQATLISETSQTTSSVLTSTGSSSSTPTTSMTTITDTSTRTRPAADTVTATYSTTSSAAATMSTITTSSTTNRTTRTDIVTPRYTTRSTTTLSGTTSSNAILGTAPAEITHSTSTIRSIRSNSMPQISVTDTSTQTYTRSSTVVTTGLGLVSTSTARATATTTLSFSTTAAATVASKSTSASTTTLTVTGTSTATGDTAFKFQLEGPSPAVPNCYLEPLVPKSGCLRAAVLVGVQFGLNHYGQETTGKRICLNHLRETGLNTFVFRAGLCELWNCSTRGALRKCADGLPLRRGTFLASQHRLVTTGRDGELVLEEDAVAGLALAVFSNEDGTVSLQSREGRYVTARPDGTVTASSTVLGTSEKFHKVSLGGSDFALRTAHSAWLTDGLGRLQASPEATRGHFQLHIREGSAMSATSGSEGHPLAHRTSVHSTLCRYQEPVGGLGGRQRRSPSYVKLWEWNYADVARECQETLGPQGFDAVQLSPFTEHVKGHQWWVRYQPVSFGLNSRSGTAPELRRAVAACRAAGVAIIADVVLNHMARPCHSAEAQTNGATPCIGWNGTRYGNRQSEGAYGWDSAGPTDFHHQVDHLTWGACGVGPETGFLCGSLVTTDCSCCKCDMYGLPDWNLSQPTVQEMHSRHLSDLFEMGVTMLRVDAALYMESEHFAAIVHRFPWDVVYQEWWHELAVPGRTDVFGLYRDLHFMRKLADLLHVANAERAAEVVMLSRGDYFIPPHEALYTTCFHDGRTDNADPATPTFKNGLAFHQQQLFMMASPFPVSVLLWSGYSWKSIEQGPPGCESGGHCVPRSPFTDLLGSATECLPTPTGTPLPAEQSSSRQWVCEHRWRGVAGLLQFRKACRGLPVEQVWTRGTVPTMRSGHVAFRTGQECFVAVARGGQGDFELSGLQLQFPSGRYCDLASYDGRSCAREVFVHDDGRIQHGVVPDGVAFLELWWFRGGIGHDHFIGNVSNGKELAVECRISEKFRKIQAEVLKSFGCSEETAATVTNGTAEEVRSHVEANKQMLADALGGLPPVLPGVEIPEDLTQERLLELYSKVQTLPLGCKRIKTDARCSDAPEVLMNWDAS